MVEWYNLRQDSHLSNYSHADSILDIAIRISASEMYGLDPALVDGLNYELSLGRIKTDVLTDFILAPHYSAVYEYAAEELIERVKSLLRSGQYTPEPPIKVGCSQAERYHAPRSNPIAHR